MNNPKNYLLIDIKEYKNILENVYHIDINGKHSIDNRDYFNIFSDIFEDIVNNIHNPRCNIRLDLLHTKGLKNNSELTSFGKSFIDACSFIKCDIIVKKLVESPNLNYYLKELKGNIVMLQHL